MSSSTVNIGGLVGAALGQTTMAGSLRVAIASDQSAVPASQSTGAGAAAPWSARLSDGAAFYVGAQTGQLPAALVGSRLDANIGAWGGTAPTAAAALSDAFANPTAPPVGAFLQGWDSAGAIWRRVPSMDAAARRAFAQITDGTNSLPTGDIVARSIFAAVGDGVRTSTWKAASTASVAADTSLVVQIHPSGIGGASGLPAFVDATDRAARLVGIVYGTVGQLAQGADNSANSTAKLPALPARANAAAPTWTEGNQVPDSVDLSGRKRTLAAGGISAQVLAVTSTSSTDTANWTVLANAIVTGLEAYLALEIEATLQGATGGTLDILLQISSDGGASWMDYVRYAQLGAGAASIVRAAGVSRADGTGSTVVTTSKTTASGTTQSSLASGGVVGGDFGDRLRVLTLAGVGTTVGASLTFSIRGGR